MVRMRETSRFQRRHEQGARGMISLHVLVGIAVILQFQQFEHAARGASFCSAQEEGLAVPSILGYKLKLFLSRCFLIQELFLLTPSS